MITVHSFEEVLTLMQSKPRLLVFKHSTTCPISAAARAEVEHYSEKCPEVPVVLISVQEQRSLSTEIAEHFAVKHESPQVLIFEDAKLKSHASHWSITQDFFNTTNK